MSLPKDFFASRLRVGVLLAIVALGSCWPLLACTNEFRTLFLFQDEWDQLREIERDGTWRWAMSVFGENFMPIGKLAWFGTLKLFSGSYFAVVAAGWVNHALNTFLLGWLLWRRGCGFAGALLAAVLFGYSATTVETLAWAIQWSNVLTVTFLLLALLQLELVLAEERAGWGAHGVLLAWLVLCALSFVRGMFAGLALAGLMLLWRDEQLSWRRRFALIGVAMIPVIAEVAFMKASATHSVNLGHFGWKTFSEMALFAVHSFAHNPVMNWFANGPLSNGQLVGLAALKTLVFALGLRFASRQLRPILFMLVLLELATDVALGAGRYWTGLGAAGSSRYQYFSLTIFLPFVGVVFARLLDVIGKTVALRTTIATALVTLAGWLVTRPWPQTMKGWCGWRGGELRAALAQPPEKTPEKLPWLEWISPEEVQRLMAKHHLH